MANKLVIESMSKRHPESSSDLKNQPRISTVPSNGPTKTKMPTPLSGYVISPKTPRPSTSGLEVTHRTPSSTSSVSRTPQTSGSISGKARTPVTPATSSSNMAMTPKTPAATPSLEELIRYYKFLTASFNKIQTKDQKSSLINAAKRPKLIEHFRDNEEVLTSYLGYLQVFLQVYPEQFEDVYKIILLSLFKMDSERDDCQMKMYETIHKTLADIISADNDLAKEMVACLTRYFPFNENTTSNSYLNYVYNYLSVCIHLPKDCMKSSMYAFMDKLIWLDLANDDHNGEATDKNSKKSIIDLSEKTLEIVYEFVDKIKQDISSNEFFLALLKTFHKYILSTARVKKIDQIIFYICSIKDIYAIELCNILWDSAIDINRGFAERKAAITYISSLVSRAMSIEMDFVVSHISRASVWCQTFNKNKKSFQSVSDSKRIRLSNQNVGDNVLVFYLVCQSIFYILTQRHRDLYDEDVVRGLRKIGLSSLVNMKLKPLQHCDAQVCQRFEGVAHMYQLCTVSPENSIVGSIKKFDESIKIKVELCWQLPFEETTTDELPTRFIPLYRVYYDYTNFTSHRDE